MRRTILRLVSTVAILSIAPAAFAADIVVPPRAPVVVAPVRPAPVPTWAGCYVGGNVGGGWSHNQVDDEVSGDPIATLNATAVVGGGQIGCDHQVSGNLVIGIQGMYDWTGLKSSTTSAALDPASLQGSIPWFATVTGRLGVITSSNMLIYGKGGVAWDHTDARIVAGGSTVDSVGFGLTGWTAGGGLEWMIKPGVSLFGEYDYLGFGDKVVSFPNSNNIGRVSQNIQVALFGVNLRLGTA